MPIRESNCHCCNTVWFLPSACSSMAYMGFSTDFVCKGFHPNSSLLLPENSEPAAESPVLLPAVLCWAVGSAPRAAEAGRPWGGPGAQCSPPHTAPTRQKCSFAVSDVELLCWQQRRADYFLARLHPLWYVLLLAANEVSQFFFMCYFFSPRKNTSEQHRQRVSSYFWLILFKLRSNQNVVMKFIDHCTT